MKKTILKIEGLHCAFFIRPLAMLFGMWGMKGRDDKNACDGSCGHQHKEAKP